MNRVSEQHFDKFPDPPLLQCRKPGFETEVCSCSNFPTDAILWIKEVEIVIQWTILLTSRSVGGHFHPIFRWLDAKIASALKTITNSCCNKRVNLEEEKAQNARPISPWKTHCVSEVEDHGEETYRSRDQSKNIQVQELNQECWSRLYKRKNVSVESKTGECLSVENKKRQCSKRDACSFRLDDSKRGYKTLLFSLAPTPQTKNDGPSESEVLQKGRMKTACRHHPEGNCTNPSCDY